jgi:hypothetical protein
MDLASSVFLNPLKPGGSMAFELSEKQKVSMFNRIWHEYVLTHGLGGMSKSDLDALIAWAFAETIDNYDHFFLGHQLKIKEARVGLRPVSQTPSLGGMMKPEVIYGNTKDVQSRVQA